MNIYKYIVNQITRPIYWTKYCNVLFFSIQLFGMLRFNLYDQVVKGLDSQSRSPVFETTSCGQRSLSRSSFWDW